jgi:hypothetical protein
MEEIRASDGSLHPTRKSAIRKEISNIDYNTEREIESHTDEFLNYTLSIDDDEFEADEYTTITEQVRKFLLNNRLEIQDLYKEVAKIEADGEKLKHLLN